jgi:hypothetical protein
MTDCDLLGRWNAPSLRDIENGHTDVDERLVP